MPTVPMVRQDDWNGVQLPTVMSADSAPLAGGDVRPYMRAWGQA